MDRLLNASEAAEFLAIPKRRVWLLGRQGALPVVRLGKRQVRYSMAALSAWVARGGLDEHCGGEARQKAANE